MTPTTAQRSIVRLFAYPALAVCLAGLALPVLGQDDAGEGPVVRAAVDAVADRTAYASGEPASLAVRIAIEPGWHVNGDRPTFDWLIPTTVEVTPPPGWGPAEVAYPEALNKSFAFAEQPLAVFEGTATVLARLAVPADAAPGTYAVAARVTYQACDDRSCVRPVDVDLPLALTVGPGGQANAPELFAAGPALVHPEALAQAAPAGIPAATGLGWILALALVGGLILNAMPCVLPVLSLKVFGLVQSAGRGRADVVAGALATAAGILASFLALAAAAAGARAAGAAVGWGVQFQQPLFVAFLAVVIVLFCLNLWGLFEIPLPARLANALGAGGPREGVAGHFSSGLFATLMATPCSAPFLGTAVGFALAQSTAVVFAVFAAVGAGMALPYFALAAFPGAARWLPRPGAWMDTLRKTMGFLLAATAIWLFYVLSAQVAPERLAAIQVSLVALALFVWLRGAAGRRSRALAAAGIAATIAATLGLAATAPAGGGPSAAATEARIAWQAFDRERAAEIAHDCGLVFVDVTADWCFTCKTNERLVLETDEIAGLFDEHGVVAMKADWTNRDDAIAGYLRTFGRASIPFYALYRPGADPHLFSELLTKGQVADVVRGAAEAALRCHG